MNPNIEILDQRINRLYREARTDEALGVASLAAVLINGALILDTVVQNHEPDGRDTVHLVTAGIAGVGVFINIRNATRKSRKADVLEGVSAQAKVGMIPQATAEEPA